MQGSWLDFLPSQEQERIRKRMRSPEAYEALREKVKGPEDLAEEMRKSEQLAELRFAMETEPEVSMALKAQVSEDIRENSMEEVLEMTSVSPDGKASLEKGDFIIQVDSDPQTNQDALVAVPEGNVQEKIPVKPSFSDRYVGQFVKQMGA